MTVEQPKSGDGGSPTTGRLLLSTDLLSGLLFAALGAGALYISWRYPAGTAARMGPGYFPHLVSSLLVLLGGILIVRAWFRPGEAIAIVDLRPLLFVLLGTVAFGLLIERAGLIVASVAVIVAGRLARPDFRVLEVLLLAVGLAGGAALLFVYALGLSVRLLPF
jgi:putative tricarboxylic transport membrane protein